MKRIDKVSKEEILEMFRENVSFCKICGFYKQPECGSSTCGEGIYEYFNEEIKTVPRIATLNTAEDVEKARKGWYEEYKNGSSTTFFDYLKEEIEVEE